MNHRATHDALFDDDMLLRRAMLHGAALSDIDAASTDHRTPANARTEFG
jgi:hypothetical protein